MPTLRCATCGRRDDCMMAVPPADTVGGLMGQVFNAVPVCRACWVAQHPDRAVEFDEAKATRETNR